MISKQQLTFVRSLHQKKYRQMYGKFLVEGDKLVRELLASPFKTDTIFRLKDWPTPTSLKNVPVIDVTEADLRKIATHENPDKVLAVAEIPVSNSIIPQLVPDLYLACDNLNDPGNAGTVIRTADWFGVKRIFFSKNSVDIYNPKVVSAAKGSLFRVECFYTDLKELFASNQQLPVYGTFMKGSNIYHAKLEKQGFIVVGNEANGISEELTEVIKHKISIPSFGKAESLNAAIATGIVLGEFRRTYPVANVT